MTTPAISTGELYGYIETLLQTDTPLFIHGSPGIGKSYIVADIARKKGLELVDIRLSQLDPVDLRGVPSIEAGRTVWMPPVFFPEDLDSEGILFLDELNAAPPSVQAAIYQLVLNRRLGEYTLPKGWRIICAGNRISDRGVVFRLPTPLANRMVHLHLEARFEDFKAFAIGAGIHHYILGFLAFRPDLLSSEPVAEDDANPAFATPRSYHILSDILHAHPKIDPIRPLIYGAIGYGAGVEFVAYVKVYESLPDIAMILEGNYPDIPADQPALLYALVSALVAYYDGSNKHQGHTLAFSSQLPTEFGVLLIGDVILKDEALSTHPDFEAWLARYGDILL
jgi:hypothetical protein